VCPCGSLCFNFAVPCACVTTVDHTRPVRSASRNACKHVVQSVPWDPWRCAMELMHTGWEKLPFRRCTDTASGSPECEHQSCILQCRALVLHHRCMRAPLYGSGGDDVIYPPTPHGTLAAVQLYSCDQFMIHNPVTVLEPRGSNPPRVSIHPPMVL
jgi:hypothetical protein